MIVKLNKEEISAILKSDTYKTFYGVEEVEDRFDLSQVEETGFCCLDENDNVLNMYKCETLEDSEVTMKKVIAVWDLGEEEITKVEKVKHILKGVLEICFRKKISTAVLLSLFSFMIFMCLKEQYYIIVVMYLWAIGKITNANEAISYIKETIEEFRLRDEALAEGEHVEFVKNEITDDVYDMKLYLTLKNNRLEKQSFLIVDI